MSSLPSQSTCVKLINSVEFHNCVKRMRDFFESRGFIEVHTQSRLSILAACEDPTTISTYNYGGEIWPLPQTGQMWLEYELLKNPEAPGFFCLSTSFRDEPNPVEGRHDKIFPMFEFEMKGDMNDMVQLEKDLLVHMGFGEESTFHEGDYLDVAKKYGVEELEHEHEAALESDYGKVYFLKNFPNNTSPFWNMKQHESGDCAYKVDVIMHGVETIGSAQRSSSVEEMRHMFYNISDGDYAQILFDKFSKERVESELQEFLGHNFFERCGGGIGVTRMIRAMKLSNLL